MRQTLIFFALFSFLFSQKNIAQVQYVNPFIGTDAHGHTYPGASVPFGMVQLSPDTRTDDSWDGASGYHYSDSLIYGFSHTHLSGTGVSDYCDILVQPFLGPLPKRNTDAASTFDKQKEQAEAAYYSVFLEKPQTLVELTATTRVGIHRYTFPKEAKTLGLLFDLEHRDLVLEAGFETGKSDTEICGKRISRSWAQEQHIYFVAQFSQPIVSKEVSTETQLEPEMATFSHKMGLFFKNLGKPLIVKVGISATSIEAARANLEAEASHFEFDQYKTAAQQTWQTALSKIEIKTENEADRTADKTVFYTALYHTMLAPNTYNDVSGSYRGRDNRIHQLAADQKAYYTVFSLWDTYRALHPLMTVLEPERVNDFIKTFLLQYEHGGRLPIWELAANETDCMIGNHAIPVISDAWLKGIRGYDGQKALEAMLFSARQSRLGLDSYQAIGFIPSEIEPESVSKTLEYAFDDFAIAKLAEQLGRPDLAAEFYLRAKNWRNLYDPNTGFIRARNNNAWHSPFDPIEVNFNYTEANAWQYRFAMPNDIDAFIEKTGGDAAFEWELDALFSAEAETSGRHQADITGLVGQYAQGNEPSHHIAYLYNYIGKPYKTQALVQEIRRDLYSDKPDGLCGNEDCGQMSAWLVFNALGFYPVVPVGGEYALSIPWFDHIKLHLDNGKTFEIEALHKTNKRTANKNQYVQQVALNGNKQTKSYIQHQTILNGGLLHFDLGDAPNLDWASTKNDCPSAKMSDTKTFVPIPFVQEGARVFDKKQKVALACDATDVQIYYTTDGSQATAQSKRYKKPFCLKKTCTVRAITLKNKNQSAIMEAKFNKLDKNLRVHTYACTYSPQYTARGVGGLVDGLRGGADFRSGGWQGFEGQNFDISLDLGKVKTLHKVGLSALQDENSWIFFPKSVNFQSSNDGLNWTDIATVATKHRSDEKGALLQDFTLDLSKKGLKARYVRIIGEGLGSCPATHKGAGLPCWLFVDEVWVE